MCWLSGHGHSGERPASSHTEASRDKSNKASSLKNDSNIYVDLKAFRVFVGVFSALDCVEQCQSFSELSILSQSDRLVLSYDHLSECPFCLHQEA